MQQELLDILVCPLCKGPLQFDKVAQQLICHADQLAFPIQEGIPMMCVEDAIHLSEKNT